MKRLLPRLGLVLMGLFVGLLLSELGARLVQPAGNADLLFNAPDASPFGLYTSDRVLGLVPTPGFSATVRSPGYAVDLRINALGLRGPDPLTVAGVPAWLAIGDSFTMSVQVAEEDSFCGQLSAATGQIFWNAGVDGYSTPGAALRYGLLDEAVGSRGALLTFFLGNDLHDNARWPQIQQEAMSKPAGRLMGPPPLPFPQGLLLRNSFLFAHYRVWARAQALTAGTDPSLQRWRHELEIFTRMGRNGLERLANQSEGALQRLANETRARGDHLMVAVAPPAFVIDRSRVPSTFGVVGLNLNEVDLDAPGQALLAALARQGIAACDLSTPLAAAQAQGEAMYLTYDGHWTRAGHRVVAEAVQACLAREGML